MNRWLATLAICLLSALLLLGPVGGAHANLGDSAADLVYTPVAPCRIIDTRNAGGRLVAGTPRDFDVAGALSGQGGAANCNIPFGPVTSVVINFVAVAPSGPGNLRAWAFGQPVPTASIINYAAVPGLNLANGLVVPICNTQTATCTKDLTVRADGNDTHLVADVVGFFRNVRKEQVRSFPLITSASNRVTTVGPLCRNGFFLDVTVPVAGQVSVEGNVVFQITHFFGTADEIQAFLATTSNTCSIVSGFGVIPADLPTSIDYFVTIPLTGVFILPAGTSRLFVNALGFLGGDDGNDRFWDARVVVTFFPN